MKYSLSTVICFMLLLSFGEVANAQSKVPMGSYSGEDQSELAANDNQFTDGRFYKNLQVDLLAGEGIFLYMTSTAFVPQLYMADLAQVSWVTGTAVDNQDNTTASTLTFIAEKDTSFLVFYTSTETAKQGAFAYGSRKLDATQMKYPENNEFCGRLTYIINNWLCFWYLLPKYDNGYLGQAVSNSVVDDNEGTINWLNEYGELLYEFEDVEAAKRKYAELIVSASMCIDKAAWEIEAEETIDYDGSKITNTYFTMTGGENGVYLQSFSISLYEDIDYGESISITLY